MGIFEFFKRKPAVTVPEQPVVSVGEEMVNKLDALGYFKYAEECDLEELKTVFRDELPKGRSMPFVDDVKPPYSKDPRQFGLDGEDLFEPGGVTDALKDMQPLFEKMNVQMNITDHFEAYDETNNCVNHSITINGKTYKIFENFQGCGWGDAAQRFADIVNDQLILQQSDERLYLMLAANEGSAVFLTKEQYSLLNSLIESSYDKPLEIQEWCKLFEVEYVSVV